MGNSDFIPRVTHGTDGTESRNGSVPTLDTDALLEAILDGIATANRTARANQAVLWRIENVCMFGIVLLGVILYRKGIQ